ncbi:glycosyltransferase family 39 protein [Thermococcus sp. LS1]|uniref:ArnT family glycosyltransferase n=1 Tax=Thermococcus sp. LS1 TaxID=1638259 RepID=UPI00143A22E3|nr:glycosyltransferase family 39 protein [Thermococcus sp. LS1]
MGKLNHKDSVYKYTLLSMIFFAYILLRLLMLESMSEYYDYDEGTYLLIARLINHGYLPYRDIFAVHPPLYYYLLAIWLKIFGDSYIIGRMLSVFFGLLSLIIAYYIGKEIKDWKLGLILSGLLTLDPLLIQVNSLVFHESSIEFFTLLSVYYFVRYIKTENERYAYIALFWVGLGSTSKFTILPYALALYILILFNRSGRIISYLQGAVRVIFNRRQVFILATVYLIMILLVMATIILWPSWYVRAVVVVPGIHRIIYWDQIIPIMIFLVIWGSLTLKIFNASYLPQVKDMISFSLHNLKRVLLLTSAFFLPKMIVEGLLGIAISTDYFSQTYLIQGGRSFPIINFFIFVSDLFEDIYKNTLEFWMFVLPVVLLVLLVVAIWAFSKKVPMSSLGRFLVVLSTITAFMYFAVSPSIITGRFILPLLLLIYILLADVLYNLPSIVQKGHVHTLGFFLVLLLLVADFGIVYQYPHGNLKFIYAVHTKTMRDDLRDYLSSADIALGTTYSLNPMNTYYLGANTVPYYIDAFGLILLEDLNVSTMLKILKEEGVEYFVISTWAYYNWVNKEFRDQLRSFASTVRMNSALLYGESYDNKDVLEMYSQSLTRNSTGPLYISTYNGRVIVWINSTEIANFYAVTHNVTFDFRTQMKLNHDYGAYIVTQYSSIPSEQVTFELFLNGSEIVLSSVSLPLIFNFTNEITVFAGATHLKLNQEANAPVDVYCGDFHLIIRGIDIRIRKISTNELEITGTKIVFGLTG